MTLWQSDCEYPETFSGDGCCICGQRERDGADPCGCNSALKRGEVR